MIVSNRELPRGWTVARLGDVVEFTRKPRGLDLSGGVPFLPMAMVSEDASDITNYEVRAKARSGTYFEEGDLLLARITPCFENGKQGIARDVPGGWGLATTEVYPMRSTVLSTRFLAQLFQTPAVHRKLVRRMEGATGRMRVPKDAIEELVIPVPPRAEQDRIVEMIEARIAELESGLGDLGNAETALARFQASILAAAVTGHLTSRVETSQSGAELLDEILRERQANRPLAEPEPPPGVELPARWTWATVDQLAALIQYGSSTKAGRAAEGVPVLRMGNISDGRLRLDDLKYLPPDHAEFPKLLLEPGDVLFNRTNSPELVGKTAVFRGELDPCSFASYLIRVRLDHRYRPELLVYYLNSALGRSWVASVVSQQVGQANVNGSKLKQLTVPVPPLEEQVMICKMAETELRVVAEMRNMIRDERARVDQLKHATLEAAVGGTLVPRDPSAMSETEPLETTPVT